MSGADPIFEECYKSYPERPEIDVATTIYTRERLEAAVDFWMGLIANATEGPGEDWFRSLQQIQPLTER